MASQQCEEVFFDYICFFFSSRRRHTRCYRDWSSGVCSSDLKTTTVNLLSGLYRADAGEIWLQGERVDRLRPHEITARGVARTFQVPKLFGNMTVLENVLVPALAALGRRADRAMPEILERAHRLLEFVTLERLCDAPAKQLSGGQGMLAQI